MGPQVWAWHEQTLQMMGESYLACGQGTAEETYRVTWLHSFTARTPLLVRVSRQGNTITLRAGRFSRQRDEAGPALRPISDVSRVLTQAEWSQFLAHLDRFAFWAQSGPFIPRGDDGSTWLVEARRGDIYHSVARHSPEDGSFRASALELLRLGGFDDPEPRGR